MNEPGGWFSTYGPSAGGMLIGGAVMWLGLWWGKRTGEIYKFPLLVGHLVITAGAVLHPDMAWLPFEGRLLTGALLFAYGAYLIYGLKPRLPHPDSER